MKTRSHLPARVVVALICLALPLTAIAENAGSKKAKAPVKSAQAKEALQPAEEIMKRSSAFFAAPPFMLAEDVHDDIVKGADVSFFLVSLQSREGFAKGHLPGAVNIPFEEITEGGSLKLVPRDRKIVFTCDDGHRSMMVSLYFNQLGYSTTAMPMGLSHWNKAASGIASPYAGSAGYPVSTEKTEAAPGNRLAAFSSKATKGEELVTERTTAVLRSGRSLFMDPSEAYEKTTKDGDKGIFLVSIQRPEDYAKGHVPGAINIPFSELTKRESLGRLPVDKKIVVVCYIGHIGAAATLFLNQLGYEAYDLRFGTLGWNDATDGLGQMKGLFLGLAKGMDYPVEGDKAK